MSQAELLKVLPASVPIRLAGETDTEKEGNVDDRTRAEITMPFRSIEDDYMDVKRQRLGEPLATIPEEVAGPETSDMMTDDPVPHVHNDG